MSLSRYCCFVYQRIIIKSDIQNSLAKCNLLHILLVKSQLYAQHCMLLYIYIYIYIYIIVLDLSLVLHYRN